MNGERQGVISGLGVVSPLGTGKTEFWRNSCSQQRSLAPVHIGAEEDGFPVVVAGRIDNFAAELFG